MKPLVSIAEAKHVYYYEETNELWIVNEEKTWDYGYYSVTWNDILFLNEKNLENFVYVGEF